MGRPLLEEIGAFAFLRNCIKDTKIIIKNSWRTLQPFVPLLGLVHEIRQGDNDPLWAVITLAILCLEQFSSKFGERARHFLWYLPHHPPQIVWWLKNSLTRMQRPLQENVCVERHARDSASSAHVAHSSA
jgi:hypothetical protein